MSLTASETQRKLAGPGAAAEAKRAHHLVAPETVAAGLAAVAAAGPRERQTAQAEAQDQQTSQVDRALRKGMEARAGGPVAALEAQDQAVQEAPGQLTPKPLTAAPVARAVAALEARAEAAAPIARATLGMAHLVRLPEPPATMALVAAGAGAVVARVAPIPATEATAAQARPEPQA